MKKVLLSVALATATLFGASAQEVVSKSGQPILPKAGDFGLSINALPTFKFIGGIFSDNDASVNGLFGNEFGLSGSYFLTDNTSVRATLGFGFNTDTQKKLVDKVGSTTNEKVEDSKKVSNSAFRLDVGYVFHRGNGRLQAFYGPEVGLNFGRNNKVTYEYGNALSATNPAHFSGVDGSSLTENKPGFTFGFGLGGFVGVEYFVAPRISISGEVGLSLGFNTQGEGVQSVEYWNGSAVKEEETKTAGGSAFDFSTKANGKIGVNFYF
ncbi:MAG: hypothetical protein LBN27_07695 [Prevotellaceae bacterium]|jgi:hypothetical protein|nr:hypothetical protein [Prevotellaceae bacterium]